MISRHVHLKFSFMNYVGKGLDKTDGTIYNYRYIITII